MNLIKILVLGNYNSLKNVYLSEIETLVGLQKKGFQIIVMGNASEEIQHYLKKNQIEFILEQPKRKFDKEFAQKIAQVAKEKKVKILYVPYGKYLKNFLPFYKNKETAIVTYYGSSSLHWHDLMAYLTYLNPKIDKIVCNSNYVYEHVKKQLFGKAKKKAIKIYRGYSSTWFKSVIPFDYTQLNVPAETIKVIMVARNVKVKDISTFLKVAQYFKDNHSIHMILVGNGLTEGNFINFPKVIKQRNIHFLGHRKDVPNLVKGADIYIQTSLSEGLGRGISEAASMGLPVITTNAGGCVELVNPNESGYVVPVKDHLKIAKHIEYLAENPHKRKEMGGQAILKIQNDLSINKTIEEFYQLFKQLV